MAINPFRRGKRKKRKSSGAAPVRRREPRLESTGKRAPAPHKAPARGKRKPVRKAPHRLVALWRYARRRMGELLRLGFWAALIGGLAFGAWFYFSLPGIEHLATPSKGPSVVVKSEDGQIIGSYGDIYGDFLAFHEFPQSLVDAVMATEDRNFYRHFGVDPVGLARATIANIRAKSVVQGGSTITQQVAKNVFLSPERTWLRKFREMFVAFRLESHFSKEEIITIYLNRVYLGAGNYGVDAAAHRYFNKSARELSLSESAILAGLLKAPSRFAPTSNPELAKKRAGQVLLNMQDAGYLQPAQVDKARKELATTISRTTKNNAASSLYFTDWLMEQLQEYMGTGQEDLVVTATLKPALQRLGEQAIATVMDKEGEAAHASQAALIAMEPDGAVRAMIGGRDYGASQYNRAAQAHRQPGSSFKLFVYLAALEAGFTPGTPVVDQPVSVGKWQPKNYDGKYRGEIALRDAVAQSVNTVAVQISEQIGRGHVVAMAKRLGVESELNADPSIALGSNEVTLLELTAAYAHLAANGARVEPYGILRIETSAGKPLYVREPRGQEQVLDSGTVGMMNSLLTGVLSYGTGRAAQIGRPAAGKTGTTSDYRDAWFMGYTPDLAAGVWVGNDDNESMKKVTGGTLPALIWREFMKPALAGVPAHELPTSSGFWQSILPWQSSAPPAAGEDRMHVEFLNRPDAVPRRVPEGNAPPEEDTPPAPPARNAESEGYTLHPQFWDKLLGVDRARRP